MKKEKKVVVEEGEVTEKESDKNREIHYNNKSWRLRFFGGFKNDIFSIQRKSNILIKGIHFFSFLLKVICFQILSRLFFYFFMTYYKLFSE